MTLGPGCVDHSALDGFKRKRNQARKAQEIIEGDAFQTVAELDRLGTQAREVR